MNDGIAVHDGVIPDCGLIVDWLEGREWQQSGVGLDGSVNTEKRDSLTAWVPLLSFRNPAVIHEMNRAVWTLLDEYARRWDFTFTGVEDVSVQRYDVGQFYKTHTDAGPGHPRIVSAVAYLNTVVEGGRTIFPHVDRVVEPVAGRVAIFPSNYVYAHEAEAPRSGVKYAAAYWARG